MRTLDRTRPFQEVYGRTSDGSRYIQDGIKFYPNEQEVPADPALAAMAVDDAPPPAKPETLTDYSTWHHLKIRREIMRRGGFYTSKQAAIDWLTKDDQA